MNISGLRSPLAAAYGFSPVARPGAASPTSATQPRREADGVARAERAEMPDGADPALWSVLTGAEKQFFARQAALGPLSYGPGARSRHADAVAVQAPRGQRLDVSA